MIAAGAALMSAWAGTVWSMSWLIASALFALTSGTILALTLRPAIEIHETHLKIGQQTVFWNEIRRLDRASWATPLLVRIALADGRKLTLLHAGDPESSHSLVRHLYRNARGALLDGVPYQLFWGEPGALPDPMDPSTRYPLLRPEDEEEVERLFQRLKTAGRLDQGNDE